MNHIGRFFNLLWVVLFSMSLVIQIQEHDTVFIIIHGIILLINFIACLVNPNLKDEDSLISVTINKTENKEW